MRQAVPDLFQISKHRIIAGTSQKAPGMVVQSADEATAAVNEINVQLEK
ncbi:hypothetical protein VINI7043_26680 [Vibrio nigripulchritudo ATCC 27043]|nr:hypothetical protein VINI7043_26680 [Vibrio nigripulchritudo ATCC 27043]